jgi:hypothetical protein
MEHPMGKFQNEKLNTAIRIEKFKIQKRASERGASLLKRHLA